MFGTAPANETASDGRASKRMAVNADASLKAVQARADMALKMVVICTQKQREMESIIGSSVPIKKGGKVNSAMMGAHAEYLKRAKGNKGHGLGDGSTYRFGAVLIALEPTIAEGDLRSKFTALLTEFKPDHPAQLRKIKLCKTEVMHSSDVVRFKLSIPSDFELESAICDAIEKLEASQRWIGPRPAGWLEVEAQKIISDGV